jgi:hypothetical protein
MKQIWILAFRAETNPLGHRIEEFQVIGRRLDHGHRTAQLDPELLRQ